MKWNKGSGEIAYYETLYNRFKIIKKQGLWGLLDCAEPDIIPYWKRLKTVKSIIGSRVND